MGTGAKIAIGCVVCIVIGCVLSCVVFFVWAGTGDQGGVRYTHEVEPYASRYIESHHLLEADEHIVAYFDASLSLDASELYILTNRRVVSSVAGAVESIPTNEIRNVTQTDQGAMGTLIVVQGEHATIAVNVAVFNGAEGFFGVLTSAWHDAAPAVVVPLDAGTTPTADDAATH